MATFNECLREEMHIFGIKVVTIEPGFFDTNLRASGASNGAAESSNKFSGGQPEDELSIAYGDFDGMMSAVGKNISAS